MNAVRPAPLLANTLRLFLALSLPACVGLSHPSKGFAHSRRTPQMTAQKLALKHYKLGIDAYTNSQYAAAIKHWQISLAKDPALPHTQEYIQRAQTMIKTIKDLPPQQDPGDTDDGDDEGAATETAQK